MQSILGFKLITDDLLATRTLLFFGCCFSSQKVGAKPEIMVDDLNAINVVDLSTDHVYLNILCLRVLAITMFKGIVVIIIIYIDWLF